MSPSDIEPCLNSITDTLPSCHITDPNPHCHLNDENPEPLTMLTFLKAPSKHKSNVNNVRQWFCFGLNSSNSNHHHLSRNLDRPRLVTDWKTQTETLMQISNSLDSPPEQIDQFAFPDPNESNEPLNLRSIPDEILLPFNEREKEILALLNDHQNISFYKTLRDLLGHNWPTFESEILRADRIQMVDRQWINAIRSSIEPLDLNLWVRFRGMIGADSLDRETKPSTEDNWVIQPVRVRRSSARSSEKRLRIVHSHDRSSRDSFVSVFGDSDQESIISHSPIRMMESIQEQEFPEHEKVVPACEQYGSALEQNPLKSDNLGQFSSPPSQFLSDSEADEPDEHHALALKILEIPLSPNRDSLKCAENHQCHPSHGLKYSFGHITQQGLGLQSSSEAC